MSAISIDVDHSVDAAYITLGERAVARTVQYDELVMIDLDEYGVAVGIEVLAQSAPLPFTDLLEKYHVHSDVVELLRMIRPNVSSFIEVTIGTDGSSAATASREPSPV